MTRQELFARYRPIRAGIQHVLRQAVAACNQADIARAVRQVAPWAEQEELTADGTVEMLADVALFEPNQRGRRAFDRFLAGHAERLGPADLAVARRMAAAWFSIFRMTERHQAAGLWLEDLLDGNRRIWLMDEAFEASAPDGAVFGMRVFDAGPFHAGFGIIVPPDAETLELCVATSERGHPLPFRHPLAATLYADQLQAAASPEPVEIALLQNLLELAVSRTRVAGQTDDAVQPPRRPRPAKRRKA